MTRSRARLLALPAALALALSLSGCGAGFLAATNRPYTPSNGTSMTVGTMDARNIMLVADETQPNTFELIGALVNNADAPETLTAVKVGGAAVTLTPITVASHSIITTGGEPRSSIVIPNATFSVGDFTEVELTFSTAGAVSAAVLALTREGTQSGG